MNRPEIAMMINGEKIVCQESNKPHLTARGRKYISAPLKWLVKNKYIVPTEGRILDYGSGRGTDADYFKWDRYDPYYQCVMPQGLFDTITCTYVLNVLEHDDRVTVLQGIASKLKDNGRAFITVRRDIKFQGWSTKNTYQVIVKLPFNIIKENKQYCIYEVTKKELDKLN